MKNILYLIVVFVVSLSCKAQNNVSKVVETNTSNPKLVVGIVVDQMRYDYLTRFYNKYGEGGFKRIINEGFNCKNNHFNYVPTKTGPGHASVFTGTTPKYHGIIGNDWYDKKLKQKVYCVEDDSVTSVGSNDAEGKVSPHRLLTTTFADENRLFTQMRGKTIGIALKDRGSVLPAGHTANAAYWFNYENDGNGNWISSSFYMNEMPKWVKDFNDSNITESYFKEWNTLYDINTYTESGSDLNTFEGGFKGKETATFPYDLAGLKDDNGGFNIIAESPYGNSLTSDFAIAAINGEELGADDITDVLTVSYSSTDKVGHNFGPDSKEIEDTYLRLDKDLERLLNALDNKVGKGNYTLFVTADHAAPNAINYMKSVKVPSGFFNESVMQKELNAFLNGKYGLSNVILSRINNQLFLDYQQLEEHKLDLQTIKKEIALKLLSYELIDKVYVTSAINHFENTSGDIELLLSNGHNQKRSGDILYVFDPFVLNSASWNKTGTDHGTGLNYDTHVPLLFFGKGIKHGETLQKTEITDIAPTMSALLGISFPNASIGKPLEFVLE
ncbi:alkaline phosphatase PafA [Confluentibacter flavum]|uniref:glycerophosphocholine cholinephosphodiesterase n=1 Tax=Confluentibacter flavum TaxID=1909700 RepID=A0A2N3HF73_9FLAO|nr:alkaline phosphatase PafA [Confluentibacter flavum]PKQ43534.1 alkaline phosphatase [Confluentibacter flavum]